ncbi:mediator of RNA polymerase II transcription subunit 24-like [Styela clava]
MQVSVHTVFKNVVLNAWKERWSEQKWTSTMRKLLQPGNVVDMFHMADVLFSQAFIGSTPNTVLLSYFNYGLKSGTLSYAAILTAISKHEDLQNTASMDYTLNILMKYIEKLNKGQILEDSMGLCKALLVILQWLLRNIEQYLKRGSGTSGVEAENLQIQKNCSTLHSLTTLPRTASLLTIARFEESSVWSHIETDLAVIKNAAVGHNMQNDVNVSCNSVSQLARCNTKTSAVFCLPKIQGNESHHGMLVNMFILLEGEWNKMTDPDTLIQQLLLLSQLCDLNVSELCLDLIRACMMGFLGSIDGDRKHKWSSVLFLSLPQHLKRLKSAIVSGNGSDFKKLSLETDFEDATASAFSELLQYDSLLDVLDQITGNCDCLSWLIDRCLSFGILKEDAATELKTRRLSMAKVSSQHPTHAVEPSKLIKYEATARQLLSVIDTSADYISKQENLLATLSQMSSNFNIILASGSITHNVQKFAKKLILFNDVVKSSTAEGGKSAQMRCLLFDFTHFLVCQIAEQYGKNVVLGSMADMDSSKYFLYNWISVYWPDDRGQILRNSKSELDVDDSRIKMYLELLQNKRERTQEQSCSIKKWHEMCTNLPRAFIELVKAWQYKVVSKADVLGACDVICNILSLSIRLTCLVEVAKYASTVPKLFWKELKEVVEKLSTHGFISPPGQEIHAAKRTNMFKGILEVLMPNSNLPGAQDNEPVKFPADVLSDLITECRETGWIGRNMLCRLEAVLKRSGAKWFCHQLVSQLLSQTRKDIVERTATVVGGIFLLDVESFVICLLRHEIPHYLTDEADHMILSAPAGNVLAQLAVSCLAIVLHNISLQQKACLSQKTAKEKLSHQLLMSGKESLASHQVHFQDEVGPTKLRRLFSSTAEHDLAASAFSSILGRENSATAQSKHSHVREPVLRALSYALDIMNMSLAERQPGPHIDFAVYFVYLASLCGELVSQAVLQLMPLTMVTELAAMASDGTFKISKFDKEFDSFNFVLSVSDLGHTFSRKVAAKAICQMVLPE